MTEKKKEVSPKRNGRPPKWETVEELENDVERYIAHCIETEDLVNKTGFAVFLGCSKDTVYEYLGNKGKDFSDAIKKLITFGEQQCIKKCFTANTQIAGTVFLMKNLHKYSDKHEVETNNKTELTINGEAINNLRIDDSSLDAVQKILDGLGGQETTD